MKTDRYSLIERVCSGYRGWGIVRILLQPVSWLGALLLIVLAATWWGALSDYRVYNQLRERGVTATAQITDERVRAIDSGSDRHLCYEYVYDDAEGRAHRGFLFRGTGKTLLTKGQFKSEDYPRISLQPGARFTVVYLPEAPGIHAPGPVLPQWDKARLVLWLIPLCLVGALAVVVFLMARSRRAGGRFVIDSTPDRLSLGVVSPSRRFVIVVFLAWLVVWNYAMFTMFIHPVIQAPAGAGAGFGAWIQLLSGAVLMIGPSLFALYAVTLIGAFTEEVVVSGDVLEHTRRLAFITLRGRYALGHDARVSAVIRTKGPIPTWYLSFVSNRKCVKLFEGQELDLEEFKRIAEALLPWFDYDLSRLRIFRSTFEDLSRGNH